MFISDNFEIHQCVRPESSGDRNIRCISTTSHKHTSDAGRIEASVKDVPLTTEIHFKPPGNLRMQGCEASLAQMVIDETNGRELVRFSQFSNPCCIEG